MAGSHYRPHRGCPTRLNVQHGRGRHLSQAKEVEEAAERRRGASVITAQLVERQEARIAAEQALQEVPPSFNIPSNCVAPCQSWGHPCSERREACPVVYSWVKQGQHSLMTWQPQFFIRHTLLAAHRRGRPARRRWRGGGWQKTAVAAARS